jgi:ribosome-associated translation inhibitor RaiA
MPNTMNLTLQHLSIRSTNALDSWIEKQIFSLQPKLQIDEANVRLVRQPEASPAYRVHVHLVTPGPDVFAEGNDHTLRAAFAKVMAQLRNQITGRAAKRENRIKSRLSAPAAKTRNSRAAL